MTSRTTPYKIALYGPGNVGGIIIREATRLPEFQVVGAFVFNELKDGQDVGTLAGIDPIGVTATRDLQKFLALDCDAVVHVSLDAPNVDSLSQFVTLLEAGKNVVTSHPYSFLPARDPAFGKAIKDACKKGNATFYAAGLNPDLMTQRVTPLLTGLSNEVTRIELEEYFDCQDQANRHNLEVIGLGQPMDMAEHEDGPALWFQRQYNYQMIEHLMYEFGVDNYRLGGEVACVPAPEDLERAVMTVSKGSCGCISYTSIGFVDDKPFISIKITYYFTSTMRPSQLGPDDVYIVQIEGRPSSRFVLGMRPSYATDAKQCESEPAPAAYHAFGNTVLQSVPIAVESPPGFRATDVPLVHWKKDQRRNVGKCYSET